MVQNGGKPLVRILIGERVYVSSKSEGRWMVSKTLSLISIGERRNCTPPYKKGGRACKSREWQLRLDTGVIVWQRGERQVAEDYTPSRPFVGHQRRREVYKHNLPVATSAVMEIVRPAPERTRLAAREGQKTENVVTSPEK